MDTAFVEIRESRADPLRLDELTVRLYRDLADRDLRVRRPMGAAPEGAKSGAVAALGALVVALGASPVVAAFAEGVFAWLAARPDRTIKVTRGADSIEISDPSPEQEQQLIEWLTRHPETRDELS
ncbi:effector-associated constant component EACC1 [Actinomadura rugatobispora]|uniref:Uncharacterized protein n=1 Tax=Actinomadura rugatobispora TaxID=1994 RepID=A0ABW1A9Z9_9ACTN|nr:hypothetical protein GCM10010200_003700 [Actinomadura rugatobispora]